MKINPQYLYDLLPAYYRLLDHEQGEPLKAFIDILAREAGIVEENIDQLYDNWFIETCDEWVVPYIGDLLQVRSLHPVEDKSVYSQRAYIANTLSYRRRKGTAPILEQLALDVTGWRTKVVEFFQLLATTQNLNHVRLQNRTTPDLREMNSLNLINTAFDTQSHTVDVRRIRPGLGKYNIQNIGLYIWRLQSYHLGKGGEGNTEETNYADAKKINPSAIIPAGCYTFSSLGLDTHLFNKPQTERDITHLAGEIHVPGPLRRRALFDTLEAIRANEKTPYPFFEKNYPPVFQILIEGESEPVHPDAITICNLNKWHLPATKYKAAVDPVLGRISFSNPDSVEKVFVSYNYGFSGDVGGGPYDRKVSLEHLANLLKNLPDNQKKREDICWQTGVSKETKAVSGEKIYTTFSDAIQAWNDLDDKKKIGLITLMDCRTYQKNLSGISRIKIREGKQLYIIAADWPVNRDENNIPFRKTGVFNPEDIRPHILGDIEIEGTDDSEGSDGGTVLFNGLLIEGKISVLKGKLADCHIHHCTLVPNKGGVLVEKQSENKTLRLDIERSICGPVTAGSVDALVKIEESIVDYKSETGLAINVPEGLLTVEKSTIYGLVNAKSIEAGNSIFTDKLKVKRRQTGCIRFSYLPIDSQTPRRYRCQPELEIQSQIKEAEKINTLDSNEMKVIKEQVSGWLVPVFNSQTYGHHAYGQLGSACPVLIRTGAENFSEMGVFNFLQQPQREGNLYVVLEEYLRLGLEAGITYVT